MGLGLGRVRQWFGAWKALTDGRLCRKPRAQRLSLAFGQYNQLLIATIMRSLPKWEAVGLWLNLLSSFFDLGYQQQGKFPSVVKQESHVL